MVEVDLWDQLNKDMASEPFPVSLEGKYTGSTSQTVEDPKSYIRRVGMLKKFDSNKMDWVKTCFALERNTGEIEPLGCIVFPDGENDDLPRTKKAICELLEGEG